MYGGLLMEMETETNDQAQSIDSIDLIRKNVMSFMYERKIREEDMSSKHFFDEFGFVKIAGFSDALEIEAMKSQMRSLVGTQWFCDDDSNKSKSVAGFTTDEKAQIDTQGSNDYFLDSARRVHFFAETDCLETDPSTGEISLKEEFKGNKKINALNKAGHGLHMIPGSFRDYTLSTKVKVLVKRLGWQDPVVPQSMYIFKQAKVGGEVTSHQDSTFLYTTPRQTCLGLWLALDDATLENGCLWVRPGSQKESVRRIFVRNPEYFNGDKSKPQMIFKNECDSQDTTSFAEVPWEGKLPDKSWPPPCSGLFTAGFIPIECKAGDLLAFQGQLDHLSLANFSDHARHTFQLHLVEGTRVGVAWSPTNWLQYPSNTPFLSLRSD